MSTLQKVIYGNGGDGLKDRITKIEVRATVIATVIGVIVGAAAQFVVSWLLKSTP